MFNNNILPVIFQLGSLGASGDLAPLAHMSLVLVGLGETYIPNKDGDFVKKDTSEVMKLMNWNPIQLKSKEGLALLNGTQFMGAYGVWSLLKSQKLSYLSDLIGTISLEAFDGRNEYFDELIHLVRPHKGQLLTAERIRGLLEGSEIQKQEKEHVQDPYSFRCIPQVHGATLDTIIYASKVITNEINSVTDNPIISVKDDKIISGGNFHGQPLAYVLDFLKIAIAELGNISERRIYNLISGKRDLPVFLTRDSGLNSGFMIPQYTAASIVSINKQFATPASIDSITSSNGQEDHVSMGANSAIQLNKIVENVKYILGIEMFTAAQALEFRRPLTSSRTIEKLLSDYRKDVRFIEKDEVMHDHIISSLNFIEKLNINEKLII